MKKIDIGDKSKTIISITPLSINADSRTFKMASSFSRIGYRSIVIEGRRSGLHRDDIHFELISTMPPAPLIQLQPLSRNIPHPKSRNFLNNSFSIFFNNLKSYLINYVLNLLKAAPGCKLYYLHSFYQFPAVYLLCLRHRAKFIYDAHDFYSNMHMEEKLSPFWRDWVQPLENWVERRCVSRAAALVTVNESIAKLMRQRFGRPVTVLRNSQDPRLDQPVVRSIREMTGVTSDHFLVVSVGQWKLDTAIEQAIIAFAQLPKRFHLAFLGKNYPSYEALLREHDMTERVHFLPPVKPAKVVPFIRGANAGLLLYHAVSANIENCLPNGFFQPLAAGLPIIYPRLPEIRRIAEDYDLGLSIDPLDLASIAQAVHSLGEDQALYARKRANVVAAQFALSWERDEDILRELVESVLYGSKRLAEPVSGTPVSKSVTKYHP